MPIVLWLSDDFICYICTFLGEYFTWESSTWVILECLVSSKAFITLYELKFLNICGSIKGSCLLKNQEKLASDWNSTYVVIPYTYVHN